jgi:hypothetical protein
VFFARKKETGMNRKVLVIALLAASAVLVAAQESGKPDPYTGTAKPPQDVSIPQDAVTQDNSGNPPAGVTGYEQPAPIPIPKPDPGRYAAAPATQAAPMALPAMQPAPSVIAQPMAQPSPATSAMANSADGTDDGIVIGSQNAMEKPALNPRDGKTFSDPDGDIVHPENVQPGDQGYGATIRVRLLDTLSTATSQTGEPFRTRVSSDVMQNGQVLIPAGAEIDGTLVGVSYGHAGGHGSMHLRPESVVMPDGSHFRIYAELSGAPGTTVHINGEGGVSPGSQLRKDGIEYGGAVGAGAVTGAILGGPGGALAGTLIGAGVITVHLLVSHPQATLDSGTVLLFTLNQPLNLVPAGQSGN